MKKYAFELGKNRELSVYELYSVLGEDNLNEKNGSAAIFNLDLQDPQNLQDSLGGTIKIAEIFDELDHRNLAQKIPSLLENYLPPFFKGHSGKINFAVSALGFSSLKDINIKEILKFSKKILKSLGLNSRFVNKSFKENPDSATLYKAKVLEKGIDIVLIRGRDKVYIGRTVALQDIDSYSKRDYGKPKRDPTVGMLPPKLAQILINLAGKKAHTIYDPFCGTGTILTEGLLLGKDVVGSDISPKMTEYSEKNCEWLKENYQVDRAYRVFTADAQLPNKIPEKIDSIVTEGYLGKPLLEVPNEQEQDKVFRELSNLHVNWLKSCGPLLQSGQKIVMCVAAFQGKDSSITHLPRFSEIAELSGFEVEKVFTYSRKDQVVARDIKVLVKK